MREGIGSGFMSMKGKEAENQRLLALVQEKEDLLKAWIQRYESEVLSFMCSIMMQCYESELLCWNSVSVVSCVSQPFPFSWYLGRHAASFGVRAD
jgi:hypothetical protein